MLSSAFDMRSFLTCFLVDTLPFRWRCIDWRLRVRPSMRCPWLEFFCYAAFAFAGNGWGYLGRGRARDIGTDRAKPPSVRSAGVPCCVGGGARVHQALLQPDLPGPSG